ncbi:hypothetical protein Thiowin_03055 [Thiorhodovibrio winogradskyi]|uniref:Uncharacterized protein n=1 Tax=Thiorhodovibrio winogradskyi TaxID=77007 RepID=A0ABZ0SC23_9GAMM|nr:hypothetical protein [Thiorhodovibrio winogradskyi]
MLGAKVPPRLAQNLGHAGLKTHALLKLRTWSSTRPGHADFQMNGMFNELPD